MKKSRFTLIEILIVCAIIFILMGILVAAAASARSKARKAATEELMHALNQAIMEYYEEFGTYPEPYSAGSGTQLVEGDEDSYKNGQIPPLKWGSKNLYDEVIKKGYGKGLVKDQFLRALDNSDDPDKIIVDGWGNEIIYVTDVDGAEHFDKTLNDVNGDSFDIALKNNTGKHKETGKYQIRSLGENQKDDNGLKDDVQSFKM